MAAIGFYHAFAQYYRFSAAGAVRDTEKGQAISTVLVGGILAAFLGPVIASFSQELFPPFIFIGPFVVLGVILALNAGLFAAVRDMPAATADPDRPGRTAGRIVTDPNFVIACSLASFSHLMMSYLMTATPIAVVGCGFPPAAAAQVVQWHLVAMFSPSLVLKFIDIDRYLWRIVELGCCFLMGTLLILLGGQRLIDFSLGLVFLGFGWSFVYVGASTLLVTTLPQADQSKAQMINELHLGGVGRRRRGVGMGPGGHRLVSARRPRLRTDRRHGLPRPRLQPPPQAPPPRPGVTIHRNPGKNCRNSKARANRPFSRRRGGVLSGQRRASWQEPHSRA